MVGTGYTACEHSTDKQNRSLSLSPVPGWNVLILPELFTALSSFQLQVNASYILANRLSPSPLAFPSWGLDLSTFKSSHVTFIIKRFLSPPLPRCPLTSLLYQISPESRMDSFFHFMDLFSKHQSHLSIKAAFPKTEDDGQLICGSPSNFLLLRVQWWCPLCLSPSFDIHRNKLLCLISQIPGCPLSLDSP